MHVFLSSRPMAEIDEREIVLDRESNEDAERGTKPREDAEQE